MWNYIHVCFLAFWNCISGHFATSWGISRQEHIGVLNLVQFWVLGCISIKCHARWSVWVWPWTSMNNMRKEFVHCVNTFKSKPNRSEVMLFSGCRTQRYVLSERSGPRFAVAPRPQGTSVAAVAGSLPSDCQALRESDLNGLWMAEV